MCIRMGGLTVYLGALQSTGVRLHCREHLMNLTFCIVNTPFLWKDLHFLQSPISVYTVNSCLSFYFLFHRLFRHGKNPF